MFTLNNLIYDNEIINELKCYPGFTFSSLLEGNDIDKRIIYINIEKDFLTFDHFYKFTLVKIFNRFINTNKKILTTGQLLFYLNKISFDPFILNILNEINNNTKISKSDKFILAWEALIRLCSIIKVDCLFIDNLEAWWEGRRNFKKDLDRCFNVLFDKIDKNSIKTYFLTYTDEKLFSKKIKIIKIKFEDLLTEEQKKSERFFDLYEEYELFIKNLDYINIKKDIELKLEDYIKRCRGEKQVRYILFIIALTNNSGMNISDIARLMEVSPGAAGSSLNRMLSSGLLKRVDKKYYIKNNFFSRFILENQ